jgi:hypothetical protein
MTHRQTCVVEVDVKTTQLLTMARQVAVHTHSAFNLPARNRGQIAR